MNRIWPTILPNLSLTFKITYIDYMTTELGRSSGIKWCVNYFSIGH